MAYRLSTAPFRVSTPTLRNLLFTFLMQFEIRLPGIIGIHADPDLQNWFNQQIKKLQLQILIYD
jgi:hypothetical protein